MTNEIFNTCYLSLVSSENLITIVYYSHLIPVILSLILGIFVLVKSKFNHFSLVFFAFIFTFSIWLISDLLAWTAINYVIVYTTWSFLPFIEIIFYIFGVYFALMVVKKSDITNLTKIPFFLILIAPFIITILGNSVTGFYQPMCEALNNNFLDQYKLVIEIILLIILLFYIIKPFIQRIPFKEHRSSFIVITSMFLFLLIFGTTEYISATTGNYEMNLYSLFLLPVFLLVIIYAVFELDIFHFKMLGTQYIVVGLVILMSGQLFFVNGTTDRLLTLMTVVLTIGLSIILFRNFKRETDQRIYIEKLSEMLKESRARLEDANVKLQSLDKLKTEFVSLASHQLRSPLTAIKGYTSMILDGDYGEINPKAKEIVERVMESSNNLTLVVEDLLSVAKIEQGGMKYASEKVDFGELVENTARDLSITAEKKGLKLIDSISKDQKYFVSGDKEKIRQVLINLIDNSMKYTPSGQIEVNMNFKEGKITLSIKDTGVGISKESIDKLFEKFSRGDGAKLNSTGSGLGLYLVKEIVEAHHGRVWVESEGEGHGSTFFVEIEGIE